MKQIRPLPLFITLIFVAYSVAWVQESYPRLMEYGHLSKREAILSSSVVPAGLWLAAGIAFFTLWASKKLGPNLISSATEKID